MTETLKLLAELSAIAEQYGQSDSQLMYLTLSLLQDAHRVRTFDDFATIYYVHVAVIVQI